MLKPLTWSCAVLLGATPARVAVAQLDALDRAPSRFATLDGGRIHYKSLGTGRTGVVLVHCWACDLTVWRQQIPALDGRTRIVLVDLPGHGRSDRGAGTFTMDRFAQSVNAVLETAGVDRAVLVGHSMGTPVVRQFYRKYPNKTIGLVAVDGPLRSILKDSVILRGFVKQLEGPDYRRTMEQMIAPMFPADSQAGLRRQLLQSGRGTSQQGVGSSRVDLQACKLEYSIVSPK